MCHMTAFNPSRFHLTKFMEIYIFNIMRKYKDKSDLPGLENIRRKSFFGALNDEQEYYGFSEDWDNAVAGEALIKDATQHLEKTENQLFQIRKFDHD